MNMEPALQAKWIAALRGQGEKKYEQGKGCLRSADNKFCCLGVLCDILTEGRWEEDKKNLYLVHYLYGNDEGKDYNYVPGSIARDIGIGVYEQQTLASRNDAGFTFAQIADIIEKREF